MARGVFVSEFVCKSFYLCFWHRGRLCAASLSLDKRTSAWCVHLVLTQFCLRKSMTLSCLCLYFFIFIYFLNFTATAVKHLPLFLIVYLSTPPPPLDSPPPYLSLQEKLSDSQLYTPGTSSTSGYKMKGQRPLSFKYYSQGLWLICIYMQAGQ